jgi:hypothetical protein
MSPRDRENSFPRMPLRAPGDARYSGRAFVWVKTKVSATAPTIHRERDLHVGMGFTTRKNAEDCLIFRTGMPTRLARDVHEVIISPRREGWDSWGDEIGIFNDPIFSADPTTTSWSHDPAGAADENCWPMADAIENHSGLQ